MQQNSHPERDACRRGSLDLPEGLHRVRLSCQSPSPGPPAGHAVPTPASRLRSEETAWQGIREKIWKQPPLRNHAERNSGHAGLGGVARQSNQSPTGPQLRSDPDSSSTPCFRKSPVVNGLAFQKKCSDTSSLVQSRDRKYLQHERNTGGRATPHA